MAIEASGNDPLIQAVTLLGAAVIMVPLFRRLGLGSVLGYLVAGLIVGPFGLAWFTEPEAILHVAELGVVMFLFVVGLEMRPSHLWSLRQQIFGLGSLQIATCAAALTAVGLLMGWPFRIAFIGALGFVLTSTAIVMQLLSERGDLARPNGQRIVSILLLEDLMIVPLLAMVAWMAPVHDTATTPHRGASMLIGVLALLALLAAGRWLLNPLFRILAGTKAREVLTAGALLVVLGAALLMQAGGLSMAMGAFLAGVLLAESSFRHQLEADIEPFRGILLGLFFLGVGMALDLSVVRADWALIVAGVLALMATKALCIYAVARVLRSGHGEAVDRASLMAQGGEFAFVLYAAASATGVISAQANARLTAMVVLSMALTPLVTLLVRRFVPACKPQVLAHLDQAVGLSGSVLMIGFGRFGQVVSQPLLARDVDVTIIDTDVEMIQAATDFGFKIYYGDGTRLDVLQAAGAGEAKVIAVCVDRAEVTNEIVELCQAQFPQATLIVRAYDREHAWHLAGEGVTRHVRETFDSALRFGTLTLRELGLTPTEAREIAREVRRRDADRFDYELAGGDWVSGAAMTFAKRPEPAPLTPPRRESRALNEATEVAARSKT
ncbi:MAG TPA: monovalent cation:proton antiporter-2 (CPA2) family protein [Lysobacter sp.]